MMPERTFRTGLFCALLLPLMILAGCGDSTPIKIGFLGGLTGRYANLGEGGRDGLLLAIEEQNQAGGIGGHKIELLIRDDAQDEAKAKQGTRELIDAGVVAIVGPMTSSMALAVLPVIDGKPVPLVSPTATSTALEGKDDALFRILSSDPEYAAQLAAHAYRKMGLRRVAILMEGSNQTYSNSLGSAFRSAFEQLGGQIAAFASFSTADTAAPEFVRAQFKNAPDAVFLIGNSVDLARLGQMARQIDPKIALLGDTVEERLLALGGAPLEGYVATQAFNRDDPSPRYREFAGKFEQRYKRSVGFAAVTAYDAGRAVLKALEQRQGQESLKEALIARGPFSGAQGDIAFDRFGDAHRPAFVVVIRDGKFALVK